MEKEILRLSLAQGQYQEESNSLGKVFRSCIWKLLKYGLENKMRYKYLQFNAPETVFI